MTRIDGWPEALFAYLHSKTMVPFQWGVHDCATLAAGAVEAMTGETLFTPTYTDAFGANTFEQSLGGMDAHLTSLFGEPVAPMQVRRGDIGMLVLEDREVLAVAVGGQVMAPGEHHALYYPITMLRCGWRVG